MNDRFSAKPDLFALELKRIERALDRPEKPREALDLEAEMGREYAPHDQED